MTWGCPIYMLYFKPLAEYFHNYKLDSPASYQGEFIQVFLVFEFYSPLHLFN